MTKLQLPENEEARLDALHKYNILDTPPEEDFDHITRLASNICGTPVALVTLIDRNRQWFKSKVGSPVSETPRDIAFCSYTILHHGLLIVRDARLDERFSSNPLVTADPSIRFYAGAPLVTNEGHALGTLCVIDRKPRDLNEDQKYALLALSYLAIRLMELRKELSSLTQQ